MFYTKSIRKRAPSTLGNYERSVTRLIDFIGDVPPTTIKIETIWAFKGHLEKLGLQSNTVHNSLIAIRNFLKFLNLKNIQALKYEHIDLPPRTRPDVKYLTQEEVRILVSSIKKEQLRDYRDIAMIETLFSTGLRVSELTALNKNIPFKKGEISIIGKGGVKASVFFSARAIEALDEYLARRKDHFKPLFINYYGRKIYSSSRLTRSGIGGILAWRGKQAGIKKRVSAHMLRHSLATTMVLKGADIYHVKEIMRHTYVTTTQCYVHIRNKRLKSFHDKYIN